MAHRYTVHLHQSPCRDTKQNKDKRHDKLGLKLNLLPGTLRLGSDGCRVLFNWVVVHNEIGYSTVQCNTVVIIYDNSVIEPYNNPVGAKAVSYGVRISLSEL